MGQVSAADLLRDLNQLDEHPRIEAKTGSELGKSALQTVCALANEPRLGGGYLLFGVRAASDPRAGRYEAVGISDADKLQADLASQCASVFNRSIRPELWTELVQGKLLVGAYVPESPAGHKPVYFANQGLPGVHSAGSDPRTSAAPKTICWCSTPIGISRRSTARPCRTLP